MRPDFVETRLDKAIMFAMAAHDGQFRKYGNTPYIYHPLEVAMICASMTNEENVIIAGLLHDTVEDTDVTMEQIEKLFGPDVKKLVSSETENKREELPPEATWAVRKMESLEDLKEADTKAKMVWLADKVSNTRSFHAMYLKEGDAMWKHFHMSDPRIQKWYYYSIAEYTKDLADYAPYQEYVWRIGEIFKNVEDYADDIL